MRGHPYIRGRREYVRCHLDQLIALDLSLGFDDIVVDEPRFEFGVRPCVVNLV
jgi:hypothetical protein